MTWLVLTSLLALPTPFLAVMMFKFLSQRSLDDDRKTYLLTFPSDLAADRFKAWLRPMAGSLVGLRSLTGVASITFETWANERGIVHRLIVPRQQAEYIASQIRSLIPGLNIIEDHDRPELNWTHAVEVGMKHPDRQLSIPNSSDFSTSLLSSVQALDQGEVVVTQWVITPLTRTNYPSKSKDSSSNSFSITKALLGVSSAGHDEIDDRRKKLDDHNFLAIGRVGAVAQEERHARRLVSNVVRALSSARSHSNGFHLLNTGNRAAGTRINDATTPLLFKAQLNTAELVGVLGWPIGSPFIAGLPSAGVRRLYAGPHIPTSGRVLGHSTFPGKERRVALDYKFAVHHTYVGGMSGVGKTTFMANSFAQDVAAGYGGIVVDLNNEGSNETLFNRTIDYIPRERLEDVIVVRPVDDPTRSVGFNPLDQGNPRIVTDQITDLFMKLYSTQSSVNLRQLMFHGLYTLAETPGLTITDLPPLINPTTTEEKTWAASVTKKVSDPELQRFWDRWNDPGNKNNARDAEPLLNKIWQLTTRPETRYMIGQSQSAFQMDEVIANNKILLIDLAGLPSETGTLMATLLLNAVWSSARKQKAAKANFLYLDELQLLDGLPVNVEDMFRRARQTNLGLVAGTQYLQNLSQEIKAAIPNTVRNRVIFRSGSNEARMWQNEFGRQFLTEHDLLNQEPYEAYAQLSTESGAPSPVSIKALKPIDPTGTRKQVLALSAAKYARPVSEIEAEGLARRTAPLKKQTTTPDPGWTKWRSR